jgi:hypothetical protein
MVCPCDSNTVIRSCPPYANAEDVNELLQAICPDCFVAVPASTPPANFCSYFGGAKDDCCEVLTVLEGDSVWYSTDCSNWYRAGCNDCYYKVPNGTLQSLWCTVAEANGIDINCCRPLFIEHENKVYITDDCVNWTLVSTADSTALQDAGSSYWTGNILVTNTSSLLDHPSLSDFNVSMLKSGLAVFDAFTSFTKTGTCDFQLSLYNSTLATYATPNFLSHVNVSSGLYHYRFFQRLSSGVYTYQLRYFNLATCSAMNFLQASQMFTTIYDTIP